MTQGSNAYSRLKKEFKDFRKTFPIIDIKTDSALRLAYKGGYCYVKDEIAGLDVGEGLVYDKNSMYPDKMRNYPMPFGVPVYFDGKYRKDTQYPLYVQSFACSFDLKDGYLPTIQDKTGRFGFNATEYLKSSNDKEMVLHLPSPDLEIFLEHYNTSSIKWIGGFKMQQSNELFKNFVDEWYAIKEKAAIDGNPGLKQIAKLMLNASYGKFGTNPERISVTPTLGEDNIVHYKQNEPETIFPEYIPVAIFITSWGRYDLITTAQKLYDRFLYSDTDSLHILGITPPDFLDIDSYRLGAWDCELKFKKARYLKQKTYMEIGYNDEVILKCASLPHNMHYLITWDNFHKGLELFGKLSHRTVEDGVILKPGPFIIH